jgi:hypothetical protein
VPLPTNPDMNQGRGWIKLAPVGSLRELHGGDGMDLCQLVV